METLTDLLELMQQAIDLEQSPANREKNLTPGLKKAMDIIRDYQAKNKFDYEYQFGDGAWKPVNGKSILQLLQIGFNIRRMK